MVFVRMSIAVPAKGKAVEATDLLRQVNETIAVSNDCVNTFVIQPEDGISEIIRVSIYKNNNPADDSTYKKSVNAFSYELNHCLERGFEERAFFG
tara:strand:+ start:379 stop:663 length:285 start_codon:yes stop_codon:yes gene_type:complete